MTTTSAATAATFPNDRDGRDPRPGALTVLALALYEPLNTAVEATPGGVTVALLVLAFAACAVSAAWGSRGRGDALE